MGRAVRHDVRSLAWCLARVDSVGLRVAPRGTPVHDWARGWATDETMWARAPERYPLPDDYDPMWWPALDAPADSDRARAWVGDACADHLAFAHAWRTYASPTPASTYHLSAIDGALDAVRPTPDMCRRVLLALAPAPPPPRAPPTPPSPPSPPSLRPLSVAEAAAVLSVPVDALRAALRRGDVRSVAVSGRRDRCVPGAEVERLIAENGSEHGKL